MLHCNYRSAKSAHEPEPAHIKAKALMKEAGYENGEIQSMDVASFYNKIEAHRADDPNQAPFKGIYPLPDGGLSVENAELSD